RFQTPFHSKSSPIHLFWGGLDLNGTRFPAPAGIEAATVEPAAARYDAALGEFVLLYDDVRRATSPDDAIARFLETTYEASATLADWDRPALEWHVPAGSRRA
ncbi:MAG: DUF5996 family protein, partial [Gaiellales bacterium]